MTSSKFVIGALAAALGVFVASKLFTDVRVRSTARSSAWRSSSAS
jgi:hypothetical protein